MHHLVVESHLVQRLLVVREFSYEVYVYIYWIGRRSNGTGSGGAYIMHCWHYGSTEGENGY